MRRRSLISALGIALIGTPLVACAAAAPTPTTPPASTPASAGPTPPPATATKPAAPTATIATPAVPPAKPTTAPATPAPSTGNVQVFQSTLARVTSPEVPAADLTKLASDSAAFAFDLYQRLAQESGNLFYSPYSISVALAMAYAGTKGQTAEQLAKTLHYTLPQDRLHPAVNALDQQLASRGAGAKAADGKAFRLKVVNSTWGQTGYAFLPTYLDVLAQNYGAGLRAIDFAASPEAARGTINGWVKDQTEGKIPELMPSGTVDAMTRLVLVNAIYFNAAWKHQFTASMTKPGSWNKLDGTRVDVPMMSQLEPLRYAQGDGYQAVELPYDGDELGLVVLVPTLGQFGTFEKSLTGARVQSIVDSLSAKSVRLQMPKFKYESEFMLVDTLKAMGATDAFDPTKADLSGMDGKRDLYISDVIHKAIVDVMEKGTEAAAATAVGIRTTSAPQVDATVTVDRPFVFLIRDVRTGAIVFVGRVVSP